MTRAVHRRPTAGYLAFCVISQMACVYALSEAGFLITPNRFAMPAVRLKHLHWPRSQPG